VASAADGTKTVVESKDLFGLAYWPALPAFLVSTVDAAGKPHVSPFSLVTFSSYTGVAEDPSVPRIITLIIGDYERFDEIQGSTTYRNIRETGEFVVNVPKVDIVREFNLTGAPDPDKFGKAGLTPSDSVEVGAPGVGECPINFECRLEAIDNRRWLGELIHGRVVCTQVSRELAERPAAERLAHLRALYHQGYDHENGMYYALGPELLDEASGQ
jgi:flavin reductase (DIM6/NTAB) family NADH-FMN oxidoreductase RutF